MKTKLKPVQARMFCAVALGISSSLSLAAAAGREVGSVECRKTWSVGAWSHLGAKAGAIVEDGIWNIGDGRPSSIFHLPSSISDQGDGPAVNPTAEGARL